MRDTIKSIIAIAFVAVSFFVGKYLADEKCSVQLKELNEKSIRYKKLIDQLQKQVPRDAAALHSPIKSQNGNDSTRQAGKPERGQTKPTISAPQQNLWVNSGVGRSPRA